MFRTLLFTAIVLFSFVACDKNEEPCECENEITDGSYIGLLRVDQTDSTFYEQEDVAVSIIVEAGDSLTLLMHKVKFSDRMPITLDMTINGIVTEETDGGLALSGDNIIPIAMGGEYPDYTITGLTGKVTADEISLSMNCGKYPLAFSGDIQILL